MKRCSYYLRFLLPMFIFLGFISQQSEAEDYTVYGSFGITVESLNPANTPLYWIACGLWRSDTGINSPEDIPYHISIDRTAKTARITGSADCYLRDPVDFSSLGNLAASFSYLMSNIDLETDPITGQSIFAIGRTAQGSGEATVSSPDGSVTFGASSQIKFTFNDKYKMPGGINGPIYGPFDANNFDFYIGPKFPSNRPPHLFFTGTNGRGLAAWIMSQSQFTINGTPVIATGGDFHGDLVNQPPVCNAIGSATYSGLSCSSANTSLKLDGTLSSDPDTTAADLKFNWSSNCPGAQFDNATSSTPNLTFQTETTDGMPTSCQVSLSLNDGETSKLCSAVVSVNPCQRDCKGVLNGQSTFDRCGVCEGDGQSCIECKDVQVQDLIIILDSRSRQLSNLSKSIGARIRKLRGKGTNLSRRENDLIVETLAIYLNIWTRVNTEIPTSFTQCANTQFCVQTSFDSVVQAIRTGLDRQLEIAKSLSTSYQKALLKKGTSSKAAKKKAQKILNKGVTYHSESLKSLEQVPLTSSRCF